MHDNLCTFAVRLCMQWSSIGAAYCDFLTPWVQKKRKIDKLSAVVTQQPPARRGARKRSPMPAPDIRTGRRHGWLMDIVPAIHKLMPRILDGYFRSDRNLCLRWPALFCLLYTTRSLPLKSGAKPRSEG